MSSNAVLVNGQRRASRAIPAPSRTTGATGATRDYSGVLWGDISLLLLYKARSSRASRASERTLPRRGATRAALVLGKRLWPAQPARDSNINN
jgi:hypothetical protein